MRHTIAAYRDTETNKFNVPFFVPFSVEDLIEQVKDGTIKGKIEGAKTFELFHLGYYDTAEAKFDLLGNPTKLLNLCDYVRE